MGGKKKTKWRKLPLEEFTKDCSKYKPRRSSEETKSDFSRKEEKDAHNVPISETTEECFQPLSNECAEYSDGIYYPTHYLIYNPVDVAVYPNYMMPADTNCYYYPPNEMNPVPEYTSVPYQEYIPPMKDTVYLLFPASAIRPTPYTSYDWRNKQRRRRNNGYAEYAVIPEKSNIDHKSSDKKGSYSTPHRSPSNLLEESVASSEKTGIVKGKKEPTSKQDIRITNKKLSTNSESVKKMGGPEIERKDDPSKKTKKVVHVCEVHHNLLNQDPGSNLKNEEGNQSDNNASPKPSLDISNTNTVNQGMDDNLSHLEISSSKSNNSNNPVEKVMTENVTHNEIAELNEDLNTNEAFERDCMDNDKIPTSTAFLPIGADNELSDSVGNEHFRPFHNTTNINDSTSKIPSVSATRSAYLPYLYNKNSDVLSFEGKATSTQTKASTNIYKFAFDESMSDRSDTESKSPSPEKQFDTGSKFPCLVDPSNAINKSLSPVNKSDSQSKSPSSVNSKATRRLVSPADLKHSDVNRPREEDARPKEYRIPFTLGIHEINVFEADSDAEAGSEDLEMMPRESECSKNKSKHLIENKLSLAVELIRTNENDLPFDSEFKIKVDDNEELSETESCRNDEKKSVDVISNQSKLKKIIPDDNQLNKFDDSLTNSRELEENIQAKGKGKTTGRQIFGASYRRYFSPASSSISHWNCCNIM